MKIKGDRAKYSQALRQNYGIFYIQKRRIYHCKLGWIFHGFIQVGENDVASITEDVKAGYGRNLVEVERGYTVIRFHNLEDGSACDGSEDDDGHENAA